MRASTSRAHAERAATGFLRAFRAAVAWLGPLGSPALAAELDGALVGAVFDGDPASYAAPPAALSVTGRACRTAYVKALPRPVPRDGGQTLRQPKRLLAARRLRAAHECAFRAGDSAGAASAAAAWREAIAAARREDLPLVGCVADDLVRAGHVDLPGAGHPGAVGAGR